MTQTTPTTPESQQETPIVRSTASTVIEMLKNILPILSQLTAFIAVGGFVVVQSYLAKTTDLFTYNISLSQYLAAGVSLLFYIPIFIAARFVQSFGQALMLLLVVALAFGIYIVQYIIRQRQQQSEIRQSFNKALENLEQFLLRIQPFHRAFNYFSLIYLFFWACLVGLLYGQTDYGTVPRWLGGGQPAMVILLFNKDFNASVMPFPVNNSRSSPVKLLSELTDGILVWDEQSHTAVKVKNDVLDGIIGAAPRTIPVLPTPTAAIATPMSATSTPTATQTP